MSLTVAFTLERADLSALRLALTKQDTRSAFWLVRVILPLFLGSAALGNLAFAFWGHSPKSYLVGLFWGALVLFPYVSNWYEWRSAVSTRHFDLRTRVELSSEGALVQDSTGTALTPWVDVASLRDHRKHLVVLRVNNTGFVVPKRAFESPEAAEKFTRFIDDQWRQAQRRSITAPSAPIARL